MVKSTREVLFKKTRFCGRILLRRGFRDFRLPGEIEGLERMSPEEIRGFQLRRLREIVEFAGKKVPRYRELFSGIDLPRTSLEDALAALPLLNRREIARENHRFIARTPARIFNIRTRTSGSTGSPIFVARSPAGISLEHAFIRRIWRWAGFKKGDPRATIRGDMIVPADRKSPPFWYFNRWENQLIMSSYHLSVENFPTYIKALRRFGPKFLQGYPSSILPLARWLLENGGKPLHLDAVLTSSETVADGFRETVAAAFGCRVFDYYGLAERCVMIGTCESGTYHQFPGYGIVEFPPAPGAPGFSEIVATGFMDLAMPFIRYRTGDLAEYEKTDTCTCGRPFPVVRRIIGRRDDTIVTASGAQVGRIDHIFKGDFPIIEARVVQEQPGAMVIELVASSRFTEDHRRLLKERCAHLLGRDMIVEIRDVPFIKRGNHGKFKAVVSKTGRNAAAATEGKRE